HNHEIANVQCADEQDAVSPLARVPLIEIREGCESADREHRLNLISARDGMPMMKYGLVDGARVVTKFASPAHKVHVFVGEYEPLVHPIERIPGAPTDCDCGEWSIGTARAVNSSARPANSVPGIRN